MGIQALPHSTVRALGACQVLNDPATVIKELLDNALDAHATSVAVEISSNTVGSIQVRDNGHGIPPEDRKLVARPCCTSKISSEHDLKTIGGTSLGFRGEALASVAEMSDSLTISTRVEGEQFAVALIINQQGEIVGQERTSLPVGTTVKIAGFVKAYPVRNQNALRNSEKCLKRIKQMLQSYAFARPQVRFALRVLKANTDKANWIYAPKAGGNAEDAAFKIVGAVCASQCVRSVVEHQGFTMQALLPKPDADVTKVSNVGAFLSVDSRPVCTTRGTPKQIVKIFRDALKKANTSFNGLKEPFIYLDILCPISSYDANVEPAKDDVLFENPDHVVETARYLFDTIYASHEPVQSLTDEADFTSKEPCQNRPVLDEDDFVTSLELPFIERSNSKPSTQFASSLIPEEVVQRLFDSWEDGQEDVAGPSKKHIFRSNMYGCDEEDLDLLHARPPTGRTEEDFEELRQAQKDVNVSNPWVIAKMHATLRSPGQMQDEWNAPGFSNVFAGNPQDLQFRSDPPPTDLVSASLPTPRPSSPSLPRDFDPITRVPRISLGDPPGVDSSQSLPLSQTVMAQRSPSMSEDELIATQLRHPRSLSAYDYGLSSQAAQPPIGTPLHSIPEVRTQSRRNPPRKQHQNLINKSFVSPMIDSSPREKVWFDHLEERDHGRKRRAAKRADPHNQDAGLVNQGELGDLSETPCQLTPPERNRDMRDFFTQADLTANDSTDALIESINYPQQKRKRSAGSADQNTPNVHPENSTSATLLNEDRFTTANKHAGVETRSGSQKNSRRASKRRKTSGAHAMREISGNARTFNGDDEEHRPDVGRRAASHRRRTTGVHRSKSALLPLERVPAGDGTHCIVFPLPTKNGDILRSTDNIDLQGSVLSWNKTAEDTGTAFTSIHGPTELQDLTARLYEVLIDRVSADEMVQDLETLVQTAVMAHKANVMNDNA